MIGRIMEAASLAALLLITTPASAADQYRRRGIERPVLKRNSWYDHEVRIRQSERRRTEYRRLRDRQESNRRAQRYNRTDYAMDSIDEDDCC